MLKRLIGAIRGQKKDGGGGDDEREFAPNETAVAYSFGYEGASDIYYINSPRGKTRLLLGFEPVNNFGREYVLDGRLEMSAAIAWASSNTYPVDSRAGGGSVGRLTLFKGSNKISLLFRRSRHVLRNNPVNDLIDEMALIYPMFDLDPSDKSIREYEMRTWIYRHWEDLKHKHS